MEKKDGGPAFPEAVSADSLGGLNFSRHKGMTLRDYFAGQALQGGLAHFMARGSSWSDYDDMAESCFNIADAMLKAREIE